jgi:hypothetical protein
VPAERFWVAFEEGQQHQLHERVEIQGEINRRGTDPAALLVCPEGGQDWKPASDHGFARGPF